ncbi:hypothetical protein B4168_3419 [Anoxybacillus flavithermus]|nr:hypothetical protein B4168_3419 [Anoxybacillus flavithermus]OAO84586.1 hypothetical protein GT23_3437 [Parageobacillus thermoglucosidasius]
MDIQGPFFDLAKIIEVIEELLVVVGWLAMPQRLSTVV